MAWSTRVALEQQGRGRWHRLVVTTLALLLATASLGALFMNGSFESGDFTGWTKQFFVRGALTGTAPNYTRDNVVLSAGGSDVSEVVGALGTGPLAQTDPQTTSGGPGLQFPRFGDFAARVGRYSGGGYNTNILNQSTVVTADAVDVVDGKVHVAFAYAVAMVDAGHTPESQPFYFVTLRNVTRGTRLYERFAYANMPGLTWYASGTTQYTGWNVVDLAPGNGALQVGDEIEIEVIAAHCALGAAAHSAWVYLDAFGAIIPGPSVAANAPAFVQAGNDLPYEYVVRNGANVAFDDAVVVLQLPTGTTLVSADSRCAVSGGTLTCNLGTLPAESRDTIPVTVNVNPPTTGTIVTGPYTIEATDSPAVFGPSMSTQVTTDTPVDLAVTVDAGDIALYPGVQSTWTMTARNLSTTTAVTGAQLTSSLPAALTNVSWTCAATGVGNTCSAASGSGSLSETIDIAALGSVVYTVTATVNPATPVGTSLSTGAAVAVPEGFVETDSTNNSDLAVQSVTQYSADLAVTLTHNGSPQQPGSALLYTIDVTNPGPLDVGGATLSTSLPASMENVTWTCVATSGTCPASGTGAPGGAVSLPLGGRLTYTVQGNVSAGAAVGAALDAQATIALPPAYADAAPGNNTASASMGVTPYATDLMVQLVVVAPPAPGGTLEYRVTVGNASGRDVPGATLSSTADAALTGLTWTCVASSGSMCPASGAGAPSGSATVLAGGSLVYTVIGSVPVTTAVGASLPLSAAIAVPAAFVDTTPADNAAMLSPTVVSWPVDLSAEVQGPAGVLRPLQAVEYVITVRNASTHTVPGVQVTMPGGIPAELTDVVWSCTAFGAGSACGNPASATLNESVTIGRNGSVRYMMSARVAASATPGQVVVVAGTAALPLSSAYSDTVPSNNTASLSRTIARTELTAITPARGLASGGTVVDLIGRGFLSIGSPTVLFGGLPAALIEIVDDTRLRVVAPALPAGTPVDVALVVTTPEAEASVLAQAYTPLDAPETTEVDTDGDGMPDRWELLFGLDPLVNDAAADADSDGMTNLQEYRAERHPRGLYTRYYAEGAQSPDFFDTRVAVLNYNAVEHAHVHVRFLRSGGQTPVVAYLDIPPASRRTVDVGSVPGLERAEFAAVVESDVPFVSDRTMRWGHNGYYGSHAETSIAAPGLEWYMAEGATHSGFSLFYLIQNSADQAAQYDVEYLLGDGTSFTRSYTAPPHSRSTLWVNREPGIAEQSHGEVSAVVRSRNGVPLLVERAMYRTIDGRMFAAGHEAAAVPAPASEWLFAEGATGGDFFSTFLLVGNPQAEPVDLTVTYYLTDGSVEVRHHEVRAKSRYTIWVNEMEGDALHAAAFAARIVSSAPVIAERAMWWPGPAADWYEAHTSFGAEQSDTQWGVADAEVGGAHGAETYLLVANMAPSQAEVTVTLYFEDGSPSVSLPLTIGATSRESLPLSRLPQTAGRRFSVTVTSTNGIPVVVESSLYTNGSDGTTWAAGSNALASTLPTTLPR